MIKIKFCFFVAYGLLFLAFSSFAKVKNERNSNSIFYEFKEYPKDIGEANNRNGVLHRY